MKTKIFTAVLAAIAAAAVMSTARAEDLPKPSELLERTIEVYKAEPVYEVRFFLQQPKNPKEAGDFETMEKLKETYRLLFSRGAGDYQQKSSSMRLEGILGSNAGTVAAYTPAAGKVVVYRPQSKKMNYPPEDKRLSHLFDLDLMALAQGQLALLGEKGAKAEVKTGSFKKNPFKEATVSCYVLVVTAADQRVTTYINKASYRLERMEVEKANPKKKDPNEKFALASRTTWFGFKKREKISGKEFTDKPIKSKR